MLEPSNAATHATQAGGSHLVHPTEASVTPISESFLQGRNIPNSLSSLCIKCIGAESFNELSSKKVLPQKLLQQMLEQFIQGPINNLTEMLQTALEHNKTIQTTNSHLERLIYLKIIGEPSSPQWRRLPAPEAYRTLLVQFETVEKDLRSKTDTCPEGQALQSSKTLLQALYADACKRNNNTNPRLQVSSSAMRTADAVLEALQNETLPAELRQITAAFFVDCVGYVPSSSANAKCDLLRSIVKSMTPQNAATYLANMTHGVLHILMSQVFGMNADDKKMFNTLLDIADRHPSDRGRAGLLEQVLLAIQQLNGWPGRVELEAKKLEVLAHLPENGKGCLSLDQAANCLSALRSTNDPRTRDNVRAAINRIVECIEPLPANQADAMQTWIRSVFSHLTHVEELASCVPRREAQ